MRQRPGHDAPIESIDDDLLNSLGVARSIHRVLSTTPPNWSTRIGLYGPWGSGKTSILNLLKALEEADNSLVVSFSAWSAVGESGVVAQFYQCLSAALKTERIRLPVLQRVKALAKRATPLKAFGELTKMGVEEFTPLPPAATKAAVEVLSRLGATTMAWAKIGDDDLQTIARLLNGRRVVVFVDDLDRADPKVIPKTLLAMRELLDWPGFAFVLAFDKRAIASALTEYSAAFGEDAQGFLEKVVDIPFEVPEAQGRELKRLAENSIRACCDVMPFGAIEVLIPVLPTQPRRVKMIARMLGALRSSLIRHGPEEIDWTGLGLYMIVKEANPAAADWVVSAATTENSDWLLWASKDDERQKREADVKKVLEDFLSKPKPPLDIERVVDAAIRLLRHWEMAPTAAVLYWVGLAFREPAITRHEFRQLRNQFAADRGPALVDDAIRQGAIRSGESQQLAATGMLDAGVESYRSAFDGMAEARTAVEWESRHAEAFSTLVLLEYLWGQETNASLLAAAKQGAVTAALQSVAERWVSWTKNTGESELRHREQQLALLAAANCDDLELLFSETDPFWNSPAAADAAGEALVKAWREKLRELLAPRVVSRLCQRLKEVDGFVPIAAGDEQLRAWLVENSNSPLYTVPALTQEFIRALRSGNSADEQARVSLAKNARLFLLQILFKTRQASWGGIDDARKIHATNPELIPAAWSAVLDIEVPFRMRSSLRKLREDLASIGVDIATLVQPAWDSE